VATSRLIWRIVVTGATAALVASTGCAPQAPVASRPSPSKPVQQGVSQYLTRGVGAADSVVGHLGDVTEDSSGTVHFELWGGGLRLRAFSRNPLPDGATGGTVLAIEPGRSEGGEVEARSTRIVRAAFAGDLVERLAAAGVKLEPDHRGAPPIGDGSGEAAYFDVEGLVLEMPPRVLITRIVGPARVGDAASEGTPLDPKVFRDGEYELTLMGWGMSASQQRQLVEAIETVMGPPLKPTSER